MSTKPTTREKLIAAATEHFDEVGYHGTDTNRIARAAGFAPQTFYRHFKDKREIFLEVYMRWQEELMVTMEDLSKSLEGLPFEKRASVVADTVVEAHAARAQLRASLTVLQHSDPVVKDVRLTTRKKQVEAGLAMSLFGEHSATTPEQVAFLTWCAESIADRIASGEAEAVGVSSDILKGQLASVMVHILSSNSN